MDRVSTRRHRDQAHCGIRRADRHVHDTVSKPLFERPICNSSRLFYDVEILAIKRNGGGTDRRYNGRTDSDRQFRRFISIDN